jgi:hypothetical protein
LVLDIDTLRLTLVLMTALTTGLMSAAALSAGSQRELRIAALANVTVCAGFALSGVPGVPLWLHAVLAYGPMG